MFQAGQTLGDFEILGHLGQGGMGAVYKARQVSLDRLVALKALQGAIASNPEYIARFRREAKAAAGLNHPNLVQVYAAGETAGQHWFAMEFVEGESAQQRLKRKGRLDPATAVAIGIHIATALDYAWRKAQLIHRDIKPDNIFLSRDGEVKLGDLGLARSADEDQSLTVTGAAMGTPHYVSPEQGEGKKDVDLRADIYSLGCTLFHFISGETPFKGDTAMGVMLKHVTAPVPELRTVWPGCPEELSRVVMKMMQKDPAERPQTYGETITDLHRAYDEFTSFPLPVPAMSAATEPFPTAKVRVPRRRLTMAMTVLGGIALAAVAAGLLWLAPWKAGGPTITPVAPSSRGWTNLIASADVKRDSLMAPWALENGALHSPDREAADENVPGSHQSFAFPLPDQPLNYDLRYRITRNTRGLAVAIGFFQGGEWGDLRIDGGYGFRLVPPKGKEKGLNMKLLGIGETHEVLVAVRENEVRASFDGKVMLEQDGTLRGGRERDQGFFPSSRITGPTVAIGVCGGSITIHSAEIRVVDRDGKPVPAPDAATPPAETAAIQIVPPATPALPSATMTPTPGVAPTPGKYDPSKPDSYIGLWKLRVGEKSVRILKDGTAHRTGDRGRESVNGTWEIVDGSFRCKWEDRGLFRGMLSEDGQTMDALGETRAVWTRQPP